MDTKDLVWFCWTVYAFNWAIVLFTEHHEFSGIIAIVFGAYALLATHVLKPFDDKDVR